MPKVGGEGRKEKRMQNFSFEQFNPFFEAVAGLTSAKEVRTFFEDVCTIKELMDITQRLQVASLLKEGKNYQEISKTTGASTATISRVNKCLLYGSGGYGLVLNKQGGDK